MFIWTLEVLFFAPRAAALNETGSTFGVNLFFFFGKSLSRLPLPIKHLTLEAEPDHPSCQLQIDGVFIDGRNCPYYTFHGHFIECAKARSNCSKKQRRGIYCKLQKMHLLRKLA